MRSLSLKFGNVHVVIRVEQGGRLRVTVNGKHYMLARKDEVMQFTEPPDDLSEELQGRIMWAVGHYFPNRK
ncbi:hypothetical protein GCM10022209_02800 [Chitinophaga oryziterrae]